MIKITKESFYKIYKTSHLQEMSTTALINEFMHIKSTILEDKVRNQTLVGTYMSDLIKRFLTCGLKDFETDDNEIENNLISFIIGLSNKCNNDFTVYDLKNYLYQFLCLLNKHDKKLGMTYEKLSNVTTNKFGLKSVDFTKGITFEDNKDPSKEGQKIIRKTSLSYNTSLDLFLTAILIPNDPDLHLEDCTKKELHKLKQDFEKCLNNMKQVAANN